MSTSRTSHAITYFYHPGLEWIDHVYHWHTCRIAGITLMDHCDLVISSRRLMTTPAAGNNGGMHHDTRVIAVDMNILIVGFVVNKFWLNTEKAT